MADSCYYIGCLPRLLCFCYVCRDFQADGVKNSCESSVLGDHEAGTFTPIQQLNRTDADLYMLFLLNGVLFCGETNDPWFTAPASFNTNIVNNGVAVSNPYTL